MRTTHAVRSSALPPLVSPRRPQLTVVWARLRAPRLDRQLASGAATWRSRAHAARALQLTSDHSRRGLARSLERLIGQSERPPAPFLPIALRAVSDMLDVQD